MLSAFSQNIAAWYQSVSTAGLNGEGPVLGISRELNVRGRVVQFWINMAGSGAKTLNYLTLSIFNFGVEVYPVQGIGYGTPEYHAVQFNAAQKSVMIQLNLHDCGLQ